ncbi:hypothetical protein ONZ45_g17127 [Pleurotus djamor]|nr:hypothetical protein ONZ45_g17127 [Pleurotus djamor]
MQRHDAEVFVDNLKEEKLLESMSVVCDARLEVLGISSPTASPKFDIQDTSGEELVFVFYKRHSPSSLRFYSLNGLKLDPLEKDLCEIRQHEPLVQNDFTSPRHGWVDGVGVLDDRLVNQCNAANLVETLVSNQAKPFGPLLTSLSSRPVQHGSLGVVRKLDPLLRLVERICDFGIGDEGLSLKDMSGTAQQVSTRTKQFRSLLTRVDDDTLRLKDYMRLERYAGDYVNFFNTVWLVLNDITIGVAVGRFLCDNCAVLGRMLSIGVMEYLVGWLQWALRWLNGWPAGLKLNTELSQFYSDMFIALVGSWGDMLWRYVLPFLPMMIYITGLMSILGGVTTGLAVGSDILGILGFHCWLGYVVTRYVYMRAVVVAGELWRLFRGRRYNVLRKRTDSHQYDVDQLLFGTMIFTLLAFLFPTIGVYYLLFALLRLSTLVLHGVIETLMAFMNHFPLFALMVRVKDPERLPGGVCFDVQGGEMGPCLVMKII